MSMIKDFIPLSKVVAAAIIDGYEDKGKVESAYFHWAARTFKDLNRKYLKTGKRKVLLPVSKNTNTATLPCDFEQEVFIGSLLNNEKVPLPLNYNLADVENIEEPECIDRCPKCNQDKAICEDLSVTETINLIMINGTAYEQNIIKKLYPNGDYYLETTDPIYNIETEEVEYPVTKKFIANLDLKPCGCLETTTENLNTLAECCPDVYGCYYATCNNSCDDFLGGYKIFEETGLIQLTSYFRGSHVYLEYRGFLPKINGQLVIPELAFEATVEGVKFRSVKNRKNVSMSERQWYKDLAGAAARDMHRIANPVRLSHIIEAAMTAPKFDIKRERWHTCFSSSIVSASGTSGISGTSATSTSTTVTGSTSGGGSTIIEITRDGVTFGKRVFIIGSAGSPIIAGDTSFIIKTEAGATEKDVMANSVNLVIDGINIDEIKYDEAFTTDQLEYKVLYGSDQTIIYLNYPASDTQKFKITYAKSS